MGVSSLIKKSVLLILAAKDFNEQEYLIVKDTLDRADFRIFIASDAHTLCVGSGGLKVKADVAFFNLHHENFAAVVFIGGSGIKNYWDNAILQLTAQKFHKSQKIVAAICSASIILARAGLLTNIEAVCYPNDRSELEKEGGEYKDAPVVIQKNIITAQSPAAASEFAYILKDYISKN